MSDQNFLSLPRKYPKLSSWITRLNTLRCHILVPFNCYVCCYARVNKTITTNYLSMMTILIIFRACLGLSVTSGHRKIQNTHQIQICKPANITNNKKKDLNSSSFFLSFWPALELIFLVCSICCYACQVQKQTVGSALILQEDTTMQSF